ncbi:MAG: creatininase family protein [Nitrospirae bacterium]|nr:MAG: creatininase family protein [Nitrospirota bacterium]
MFIEEMTMEEFKRGLRKTKTILIPFGTVEEHGRHLPLSTDTMVAVEALRRVAEKLKVFIAPPLHYGVCTSTRQHPGTITIKPSTLRALTRDIVVDCYKKGLRNFVLVTGHGGGLHINAMKEVAEELVEELKGIRMAVVCPYNLLWTELSEIAETENDSHAGEIETSLVLAIKPELVKGRSKEEYPSFPKPLVVKDKLKYWPGGVWGNPKKATPEKGERVFELIVDRLISVIKEVER